jgi:hypothetical protein
VSLYTWQIKVKEIHRMVEDRMGSSAYCNELLDFTNHGKFKKPTARECVAYIMMVSRYESE